MAPTGMLGLDETDPTTAPDYLGQPVPLAPSSQPALPVTGGPAVGAPAGPAVPGTAGEGGVPVTAGAGGTQLGSLSPSLLRLALSGGIKLSDLAGRIFRGSQDPSGGAVETPSGQLTTSAPEVLRSTQFPESALPQISPGAALDPAAWADAGAMGSGAEALDGGGALATGDAAGGTSSMGLAEIASQLGITPELAGELSAAFGGVGGLLGLVQGIRTGNPTEAALGGLTAASTVSGLAGGPTISGAVGSALGAGAASALAGAGVVTAPFVLGPILAGLFGSDINVMDMFTGGKATAYEKFGGKLQANERQQGVGLTTLAQALPYVQSKEELGQLLNMYRTYVGSTQDAPLGTPSGVYNLTTIPGMEGTEHGGHGPSVDWGPDTAYLQGIIDRYAAVLPGQAIADFGAVPTGPDGMRLWQQFTDREQSAPKYQAADQPGYEMQAGEGTTPVPEVPQGFYGQYTTADQLAYGQPGYDYAGSGYPEPGQYVGAVNPIFASLFGGQQGDAGASGSADGGMVSEAFGSSGPPGPSAGVSPGGGGAEMDLETIYG